MERSEKEKEVEYLSGKLSSSEITLCANYRGLTVAQITQLRRELRASGASGRVVKNTLAKISAQNTLKDGNEDECAKFLKIFSGPTFIVFGGDDPVAPSKVMAKFAQEIESFELKGGWFEGSYLDSAGLKQLSTLPSREETLGKLLGLLSAPATQLVRLLQAPGSQMVRLLEAQRKNLEKK